MDSNLAVGSTLIEFWPSDQLLAVENFEFMRQNLSLPRVNNFCPLDKKIQRNQLGRYWPILADISPISVDISFKMIFLDFFFFCIFLHAANFTYFEYDMSVHNRYIADISAILIDIFRFFLRSTMVC